MELLIAGLPVSGVIVALVEGAKRLGVPTRWAPLLAVGLGVACGVLGQLAAVIPAVQAWYGAVGGGVVIGLSAAGLYSGARSMIAPSRGGGTDSA